MARKGVNQIIQLLVDGGEYLDRADTLTEVTPLMYALCYEKLDVVKTLLFENAVNKPDLEKRCNLPGISDDISPLECAKESKNNQLISLISKAL